MKKLFIILAASITLLNSCKKAEFAGEDPTGEGLVDFTLVNPISGTNLVLNAATPLNNVVFSWNPSRPGLTTLPTYTLVMALRTGGDLNAPLVSFDVPAGSTSVTLTQKQIDDALKAKSIADGAMSELKWSVKATNGSATILSTSVFNINITRMKDGATPFVLLGPAPSTTPIEINPTSTTENLKFNWTRSKPATGGPAITYRVLFAERKLDVNGNEIAINWNAPLFSIASDNAGVDSLLTVTYKRFSDSIAAHGYADLGLQANLKWTVQATSGTWKQMADYQNNFFVLRQVKFFIVGGVQNPQWDINNPLEMIADKKSDRYGKVFYTYVYMTAGTEFKFFKTKGDWGSGYGNNGTSGAGYATGFNVGGNFQAATTGVYRLTIDVGANMAYVQQKQVGVVGNMQGWNPATPIYGGLVKRDLFIIIAPSNGTDPFKFHDGPVWDNSTVDKARWWGAATGSENLDPDAADIVADVTPRTRLIWDGTNTQQVKYQKNSAAQMRIVGDGINQAGVNDWDPGTSPQMTYAGNGKWTLTVALKANKEIKFLAGNAWGAFDYEDNSGGSTATGTPRSIKWDGSANFKTPVTAGTYTVTLDEYAQTVTIAP